MAVIRPLLSIAREETAIITSELANAASSSKVPIPVATIGEIGAGRIAADMTTSTMRRAGEIGLKDGAALGGKYSAWLGKIHKLIFLFRFDIITTSLSCPCTTYKT